MIRIPLTNGGHMTVDPEDEENGAMREEPNAYIWRCEQGHEFTVSERMMRQSIIEPQCQLAGCEARLVDKVRPFPPNERMGADLVYWRKRAAFYEAETDRLHAVVDGMHHYAETEDKWDRIFWNGTEMRGGLARGHQHMAFLSEPDSRCPACVKWAEEGML